MTLAIEATDEEPIHEKFFDTGPLCPALFNTPQSPIVFQILQHYRMKAMTRNPLLADLARASDLLQHVDEKKLAFAPDSNVSSDIQELTGLEAYPVDSHRANLQARIEAVTKAGDRLVSRGPSDYVSKLIVECVKFAPSSDDW